MKKIKLMTLAMLSGVALLSYGQTRPFDELLEEGRTRPLGEADDPNLEWRVRFDRSDLFRVDRSGNSGSKYDTTRWAASPPDVQSWVWRNQENIVEEDGKVTITARYNPNGFNTRQVASGCVNGAPSTTRENVRFSSGMLRSTAPGFVYGYYEAAVRGSSTFPAVSPSFWLFNTIDDTRRAVGQVRYQEIDIVEMTQEGTDSSTRKVMDHNLHGITSAGARVNFDNSINPPVGGFTPRVTNGSIEVGPLNGVAGRRFWRPKQNSAGLRTVTDRFEPRDINIYGCRVTEQEIIWYVNGEEIGRKPNVLWKSSQTANPMRITLSLGIRAPYTQFCSNGFVLPEPRFLDQAANVFPQSMEVFYVKVFEPTTGTPSTVPATGVNLQVSEVPLRIGGHSLLTQEFSPINASNKNFTFFTVSGGNNAAIDSNTGVVTGLRAGSATFRVITEDGNHFDDVTVTVANNPGQTATVNIPAPNGSAGAPGTGGTTTGGTTTGGTTTGGGSGDCATLPTWQRGTRYSTNQRVQLDNIIYRLQNNSAGRCRPGLGSDCSINQWANEGACGSGTTTGGTTTDGGSANCSSIPTWDRSTIYTRDDRVVRDNVIYRLQNNSTGRCLPGGSLQCSSNQWELVGPCSSSKIIGAASSAVKLYPNPAVNFVNITSSIGSTISIINLSGVELDSKVSEGDITLFDLSNYSSGIYIVRITGNNKTVIKKLSIN